MKPGTRPLLQVAVDTVDLDAARALVGAVYRYADIIELGTPLILEEGLRAVEMVKAGWPDTACLADMKIMDGGFVEATSGFRRGADYVTVLALAEDSTILGALEAAASFGRRVMVDLIRVPNPVERVRELRALGVDLICLHTAFDAQGDVDPLAHLRAVRAAFEGQVAIAGGLGLDNVEQAVHSGVDVIVVGGAISRHPEPGRAAAAIIEALGSAST